MLKSSARTVIRLKGVRHNNLKNFDLDLPLNRLIVITGLSGSGKSSLAFDTLFAEGQRRYIETFSPYARQFFDRMDKPQVDSIEGIPPAIAIEQRNSVRTTRSTVGTMTELCDYMKLLWPHVARLHCKQCGQPVRKDSPQQIWSECISGARRPASEPTKQGRAEPMKEVLVTFDLPLSEKLSLEESLTLVSKQGYQRLLIGEEVVRLDEFLMRPHPPRLAALTVVQDRVKAGPASRARFVEACEQAYHFGKGKLSIWEISGAKGTIGTPRRFSNRLHCARCDIEYREPTAALFSFNNPVGACPKCKGFGRVISIDYNLAIPDSSRTLAQGVVKPWLTGHGLESQQDLMRACRELEIPTHVPFAKLPKKWQTFVIEGEADYGKDEEHEWPRAWYGVKGYFRWLESKAYKMHVRVLLSRYRAYTMCPDCGGMRFQPEALLYRAVAAGAGKRTNLTLADFYQLPIRDSLGFIDSFAAGRQFKTSDPLGLILNEVRSRLTYLNDVGLGYLTLDRPTRSLSGGETERVSLTTCLGTRLVNTLFVLDEPSVGLHPRDTGRLVRILEQLRNAGNTVVVVEHEPSVMRAADEIIDLGPGHGATGGEVVFQGTFKNILKSNASLTGQYLSERKQIPVPERRPVACASSPRSRNSISSFSRYPDLQSSSALILNDAPGGIGDMQSAPPALRLEGGTRHNLKDVDVEIPLGRFVCVTGVSGSGKTTLVREVLLPALLARLGGEGATVKASDRLGNGGSGDGKEEGTEAKLPANDAKKEGDDDSEESKGASAIASASLSGWQSIRRVVLVDQATLGKTPRSNPAVYIGAFDDIREVFAQSEIAQQRGLNGSAFSFNSAQGQCERCRGAGFEKIEMQFLSDVFIRCPDCNGRRYRSHILEVKIRAELESAGGNGKTGRTQPKAVSWSIGDLLEATVEEAIEFLACFKDSRPSQRAMNALKLLAEVGLGYLKLGQPINTLSGGESQRLKLVRYLAEAMQPAASPAALNRLSNIDVVGPAQRAESTLFLFDEPTTGLHFDDVRVLVGVFQRLVDAGHSVLVIEHNLDVIKCADWLIDLGPDAGDEGGRIVAEGTPEQVAACPESHTGRALTSVLQTRLYGLTSKPSD
jgi:excinuclease ABC subunit A